MFNKTLITSFNFLTWLTRIVAVTSTLPTLPACLACKPATFNLSELKPFIISNNKFDLSFAEIRMSTGYVEFSKSSLQKTSTNLSFELATFGHSDLWTVIPFPLVIYPIISSPGIGVQQLAKVIAIFPTPLQ